MNNSVCTERIGCEHLKMSSIFGLAACLLLVIHSCESTVYEVSSLSHFQRRSTVNLTVDFNGVAMSPSTMPERRRLLCDAIRVQVEKTMAIDGRVGFVANSTVVVWQKAPSTISFVVVVIRGSGKALDQGSLLAALAEVDYKSVAATLVDLRLIPMLRNPSLRNVV